MTDQRCIFDMMNAMLKDSILEFPCKNDGDMMEKGDPLVETMPTCAYGREEQINFTVDAEESARDLNVTAAVSERFQMCPEASKSPRSDLAEEQIKWLLRSWNYDLKSSNTSDRTAREMNGPLASGTLI